MVNPLKPHEHALTHCCLTTSQSRGLDSEPNVTLPSVQEEHKETNTKLQNPTTSKSSAEILPSSQNLYTPNYFRKPFDSGICCYSGKF